MKSAKPLITLASLSSVRKIEATLSTHVALKHNMAVIDVHVEQACHRSFPWTETTAIQYDVDMIDQTTRYSFSSGLTALPNRRRFLGFGVAMGATALLPAGIARAFDLDAALTPRIIGNPDAPLHMAEYFSLSCSHCASFTKAPLRS